MKCPICGEEIAKGKSKCLRCGYEVKDVSVYTEPEHEEPIQTHDIDPDNVHLSGGSRAHGGGIFGDVFGDVFGGSVFGGIGGILDGIFGDMFGSIGYDEYGDDDYEQTAYDDFGNPIPADMYDREFVEVREVEYVEDEAEKKAEHSQKGQSSDGGKSKDAEKRSPSRHGGGKKNMRGHKRGRPRRDRG